ncbi:hypothetical protein F5144DRAFT_552769 [Chaetomium tenue]|uniref:Uncharacterized protein n=1 Tax=Chaetomium tenue TaxID=1854479 RepID=A0ACB7PJI2_9PEZI|nr:hypothetical protein F5144DRAFT_552769 [Chaetomium globosum]
MLPDISSSFWALNLLALLLFPLSQPVNALPTPQTDKECSPEPCPIILDTYPMTPYCYKDQLYCTVSGYLTVAMGPCGLWCPSEPGMGNSGNSP